MPNGHSTIAPPHGEKADGRGFLLTVLTCNCYVRQLATARQFSLRYGAHSLDCPAYRESRDPSDRANDEATRAALSFDILAGLELQPIDDERAQRETVPTARILFAIARVLADTDFSQLDPEDNFALIDALHFTAKETLSAEDAKHAGDAATREAK